jgi:hypothetical protein
MAPAKGGKGGGPRCGRDGVCCLQLFSPPTVHCASSALQSAVVGRRMGARASGAVALAERRSRGSKAPPGTATAQPPPARGSATSHRLSHTDKKKPEAARPAAPPHRPAYERNRASRCQKGPGRQGEGGRSFLMFCACVRVRKTLHVARPLPPRPRSGPPAPAPSPAALIPAATRASCADPVAVLLPPASSERRVTVQHATPRWLLLARAPLTHAWQRA